MRGDVDLTPSLKALWQVESALELASTPAPARFELGTRNSYLGLSSTLGALKAGKFDTPYKTATEKLDPFANTLGDYNAIMGNSGGDNRVEFDLRLSNAVWYESPPLGGLRLHVMYAAGEILGEDTGDLPVTSSYFSNPLCNGAAHGTSGSLPSEGQGGARHCDDGSFRDAYSAALTYSVGAALVAVASELHKAVNRTGDGYGVEDEVATKAALAYTLDPSGTTLGGAYERMRRSGVRSERTRDGTYLSLTQRVGAAGTEALLAWAHAGMTPDPNGLAADDRADLAAVGLRHRYGARAAVYLVAAQDKNGPGGHYGLGQGGHGIVANPQLQGGLPPNTPAATSPPGSLFRGISTGMALNF